MARDIFNSRKGFYNIAFFYNVDVLNTKINIVKQEKKAIKFNARQHQSASLVKSVFGGVFQLSSTNIAISTTDKDIDFQPNGLVIFKGKDYMITEVQRVNKNERNEFSENSTSEIFLSLRGFR